MADPTFPATLLASSGRAEGVIIRKQQMTRGGRKKRLIEIIDAALDILAEDDDASDPFILNQ